MVSASWEVEAGGTQSRCSLRKVSTRLSEKQGLSKIQRPGAMAEVVGYLPSKHEVLSSLVYSLVLPKKPKTKKPDLLICDV
jgi:hypothetical protein